MSLPQDNIIDIFLLNPCDDLYNVIDDKELALKRLREQEDSAQKLYFLHSKGDKILRYNIIKCAIKENNKEIFYTVVDSIDYDDNSVKIMDYCAKYGRLEMLKYIVDKFPIEIVEDELGVPNDCDDLAEVAAKNGHMEIIEYMFSLGAKDINLVASRAAEGGHREILDSLIDGIKDEYNNTIEAYDWNYLATGSAQGNNKEILDYLIEKGARVNFETAKFAALYGGIDILYYIIEKMGECPNFWNDITRNLPRYNNRKILEYLIEKGANNFITMAKEAARYGHRDLVKFLLEKAKQNNELETEHINNIASIAAMHETMKLQKEAVNNYSAILDDMIKGFKDMDGNIVCANNWHTIAKGAARGGNMRILKDMVERSENNDWNSLANEARNNIDVLDYLIEMGADDKECISYSAVCNGRVDILEKMDTFTKDEVDEYIALALEKGQRGAADFFYEIKKERRFNSFMSCI